VASTIWEALPVIAQAVAPAVDEPGIIEDNCAASRPQQSRANWMYGENSIIFASGACIDVALIESADALKRDSV
jgi:hypothetical protein